MDNLLQFLAIMAAFSTASQTLTEHLIKKRWAAALDVTLVDPVQEARRQSIIHLYSGVIGALLAFTTGLHPIADLALAGRHADSPVVQWPWLECLLVGVLVSFGGSFFNELLGAFSEFKDAQATIKQVGAAQVAAAQSAALTGANDPTGSNMADTPATTALPTSAEDIAAFDSALPPLTDDQGSPAIELHPYPDTPGDDGDQI